MLHIVTVATHEERYLPVLEKQLQDKELDLEKLGLGQKYKGHKMKDTELLSFLKSVEKDDIVVFVDGFDTLCMADKEEILTKFKKYNKKLVISIENVGNLSFIHNAIFDKVRNKFINTGLFIGYAGFLEKFLETMYTYESDSKSNQKTWSNFLFRNAWKHFSMEDIGLDINNELFLNYSFSVSDKYKIKNKRVYLNDSKYPCFIQGNGCTNMNALIKKNGYSKENKYGHKIFYDSLAYTYKAMFYTYAPILNLYIYLIVILIIIACTVIYLNRANIKKSLYNVRNKFKLR